MYQSAVSYSSNENMKISAATKFEKRYGLPRHPRLIDTYDVSPPHHPERLLSNDELSLSLPIYRANNNDSNFHLQKHCSIFPYTLIRGLVDEFSINLTVFETKTLVETNPRFAVSSYIFKGKDFLREEKTTIAKHAKYQESFVGGCDQIKFGMIYFDSTDAADVWKDQIAEVKKLPNFLQPSSASDMLSYAGTKIGGVNVMQLYLKVTGNRTNVHQEDLNFCSVNLNVGPSRCTWYFVPKEYWGALYNYAKKLGVNYFGRMWWPNVNELRKANIPVHVVHQHAGDLIYTNVGTPHWVESLGRTNHISWNVAPKTELQYRWAMDRYRFNQLQRIENVIPLTHMLWNMARDTEFMQNGFGILIQDDLACSLTETLAAYSDLQSKNVTLEKYDRRPDENYQTCFQCKVELFNFIIVKKAGGHKTFCIKCIPANDGSYTCLYEYELQELQDVYKNAFLALNPFGFDYELLTKTTEFSLDEV